jgi:hypothetical protein
MRTSQPSVGHQTEVAHRRCANIAGSRLATGPITALRAHDHEFTTCERPYEHGEKSGAS